MELSLIGLKNIVGKGETVGYPCFEKSSFSRSLNGGIVWFTLVLHNGIEVSTVSLETGITIDSITKTIYWNITEMFESLDYVVKKSLELPY